MKRYRLKFFPIGTVALAAAILVTGAVGCSPQTKPPSTAGEAGQTEKPTPKQGGTITLAFANEPETLDVHQSTGTNVVDYISSYMGGALIRIDPATGKILPSLAESYKMSEDGKTWTFTIRSDAAFHDGTKLTAKSFKETFDRLLNPQTGSKSMQFLLESVESIQALDERTLVIQLKEPDVTQIPNFADAGFLQPLSMEAIAKAGKGYGRNPVGVGPWKFQSWKTGESITLVRNEAFHWGDTFFENQGPPRADKLVIKFIPEVNTRANALETGTIDIAEVDGKEVKRFRNNPKFEVIEELNYGLGTGLLMNLKKEPFQDLRVRQAINMAINKEAMVKAVLQGEGEVAHSALSPNIIGYDKAAETYDYTYNPDEAKKLLDAAGWLVNGQGVREKNGKTLEVSFLTGPKKSEAELLQSMLKEVGIKVTINQMESAAMSMAQTKGEFDLSLLGYTYNDPHALYVLFHSSQIGGMNMSAVSDGKLDGLLEKGRRTFDLEERKKIYAEAQKLMSEQAYMVPIYNDKHFYVVNSRVKGVKVIESGIYLNDSWVNE